MKFTVTFDMDNAAFEESPYGEIKRALSQAYERAFHNRGIADARRHGSAEGRVADSNGNTIGKWRIDRD